MPEQADQCHCSACRLYILKLLLVCQNHHIPSDLQQQFYKQQQQRHSCHKVSKKSSACNISKDTTVTELSQEFHIIVERIQLSYCISRSFTCNSNEDTTVILLSQTVANAILVKKQRSQNYLTFNICEDKFVTVSLIVKQIIDNDYWHDTNTSIFTLTKSGSMNYNSKATTTVAICLASKTALQTMLFTTQRLVIN